MNLNLIYIATHAQLDIIWQKNTHMISNAQNANKLTALNALPNQTLHHHHMMTCHQFAQSVRMAFSLPKMAVANNATNHVKHVMGLLNSIALIAMKGIIGITKINAAYAVLHVKNAKAHQQRVHHAKIIIMP